MTFTITFAEDDNMFQLARAAMTGEVDDRAGAVLDYFAGPAAREAAARLIRAGQAAGLADVDAVVCTSTEELRAALADTDVLVTESVPVGPAELDAGRGRLAAVLKFGRVLDAIDLDRAAEHGVDVKTFRRRTNVSCAEHTVALIFATARRLTEGHRRVVDLDAIPERPSTSTGQIRNRFNWGALDDITLLDGSTLGLLGFGEIAREVASRATALGMRVIYHKRTPIQHATLPPELQEVEAVSFDELLDRSDVVSIHLPGGTSTEGVIGAGALDRMKHGATLINMSRGSIVDEVALEAALRAGKLRAAGLDVHREEPVPADSPLLGRPEVAWSPHVASGGSSYVLDEVRLLVERIGSLRDTSGSRGVG